jgi:hypothetical protein
MGADPDSGPGLDQTLQGGKRRPDPEVVADLTVFYGDIEIGANKDVQVFDVDVVEGQEIGHGLNLR